MGCASSLPYKDVGTPDEALAELSADPIIAKRIKAFYTEFRKLDKDKDGYLTAADAQASNVPMTIFIAIVRAGSLTPVLGTTLTPPHPAATGSSSSKKKKQATPSQSASLAAPSSLIITTTTPETDRISFSEYALLKLSSEFPSAKDFQWRLRAVKWFKEFDIDGNTKLDFQEIRMAIKSSRIEMTDMELNDRVENLDANHDKCLNVREFTQLVVEALEKADIKAKAARDVWAAETATKKTSPTPTKTGGRNEEEDDEEENKDGDSDQEVEANKDDE